MEIETNQDYYQTPHERYQLISYLGKGAYGEVTKRKDTYNNNMVVAEKEFDLTRFPSYSKDGFPLEIIREIKVLRELKHKNIVKIHDYYIKYPSLYMVMEFQPNDLEKEIHNSNLRNNKEQIRKYMKEIIEGVNYLHMNFILHRDLKPANILISENNEIKITDFGSARPFGATNDHFTKGVCTQNYRAPEIWFGADIYGPAIDVWSVGCIFSEMYSGKMLFEGVSPVDVLASIYRILGTPNSTKDTNWEGVENLSDYVPPKVPNTVNALRSQAQMISTEDYDAYILLYYMMKYDPMDRISCHKALQQKYFIVEEMD